MFTQRSFCAFFFVRINLSPLVNFYSEAHLVLPTYPLLTTFARIIPANWIIVAAAKTPPKQMSLENPWLKMAKVDSDSPSHQLELMHKQWVHTFIFLIYSAILKFALVFSLKFTLCAKCKYQIRKWNQGINVGKWSNEVRMEFSTYLICAHTSTNSCGFHGHIYFSQTAVSRASYQ